MVVEVGPEMSELRYFGNQRCPRMARLKDTIDLSRMDAEPNDAARVLIHDHQDPVRPQRGRLAPEQIHTPETVFHVAQERQPRGIRQECGPPADRLGDRCRERFTMLPGRLWRSCVIRSTLQTGSTLQKSWKSGVAAARMPPRNTKGSKAYKAPSSPSVCPYIPLQRDPFYAAAAAPSDYRTWLSLFIGIILLGQES